MVPPSPGATEVEEEDYAWSECADTRTTCWSRASPLEELVCERLATRIRSDGFTLPSLVLRNSFLRFCQFLLSAFQLLGFNFDFGANLRITRFFGLKLLGNGFPSFFRSRHFEWK